MALGMFQSTASPIAIDFGTSSVKLLQVTDSEPPAVVAAAELSGGVPQGQRGGQKNIDVSITWLYHFKPPIVRGRGAPKQWFYR